MVSGVQELLQKLGEHAHAAAMVATEIQKQASQHTDEAATIDGKKAELVKLTEKRDALLAEVEQLELKRAKAQSMLDQLRERLA